MVKVKDHDCTPPHFPTCYIKDTLFLVMALNSDAARNFVKSSDRNINVRTGHG